MQTKLKEILFEKKITQKELAKAIGMTEHSMSNKINGLTEFTYTEVYQVCNVLCITNPLEVFKAKRKGENNGK